MNKVKYSGEKQRLDTHISSLLGITRSQAQKKIRAGEIKVNEKTANPNKILIQGDMIAILDKKSPEKIKTAPKVKIIHEDENIIVIDKDTGIVVYPDSTHKSGTLLDAVRGKIKITGSERPGVVHRLDKDTSGLIIFAKNEETERELKKILKERRLEKTYLALVQGKVVPKKGRIDIPIKRSEKDRKKMEASPSGRESLTEYEVIKYYKNMTLMKIRLITGRTHQIRVHFAGIGYPVIGDKTYGSRYSVIPTPSVIPAKAGISRQFLHAHELAFELFGKKYHFKSELPGDLGKFLDSL
ncbi:RluA family pseudouridine synthase [candidate division WS5 bacterium]|uniref:Pseudouridine synthase n=1 Tax=candidate division WS5 bacterium TaxID=2093353 RepID=A0A419DA63_9BACT|nr:MAG: RluA family pseudouridine synthase [candidate division WS5 bacterium]